MCPERSLWGRGMEGLYTPSLANAPSPASHVSESDMSSHLSAIVYVRNVVTWMLFCCVARLWEWWYPPPHPSTFPFYLRKLKKRYDVYLRLQRREEAVEKHTHRAFVVVFLGRAKTWKGSVEKKFWKARKERFIYLKSGQCALCLNDRLKNPHLCGHLSAIGFFCNVVIWMLFCWVAGWL